MDLLEDHHPPANSASSVTKATVDLCELVTQLQQEKLLVNAEKSVIQNFNQQLSSSTEDFLRKAWINFQQRMNLNSLVGARASVSAAQCTKRARALTNSIFIDANKVLEYQVMVNYSAFISCLRTRPELVAQWVVIGESLIEDQRAFSSILHSLVTGLYGALLLPQDVRLMMTLLQCLAKLQLVTTDNPRRLLRQQLCAFSRMYFLFHEGLTSAKLFLIAALQAPILKLIATSDAYLDIDPDKMLSRLSAPERREKFGDEGTDVYDAKIGQYRAWSVRRLCEAAKLFVASLQDNVYCFPSSLAWLIRQIAHMISKSFSPNSREINAITTDLIFTLFVCPAIVQPEPYGISDAPVSEVARHNLVQVGTIIQMLALMKFETPDAKLMDLYKLFDADCIANFLDTILNNSDHYDIVSEQIPVENVAGVARRIALFTEQELYDLVAFLKRAQNSISQDQQGSEEASSDDYCSNNADNAAAQPNDPAVVLVNKLPTSNEALCSPNASPKRAQQLLLRARLHLLRQAGNGDAEPESSAASGSSGGGGGSSSVVLIIPLDVEDEPIGLLPEEKVVAMEREAGAEGTLGDVGADADAVAVAVAGGPAERRTRFSHNDDGSIGNTSDNLEVISEAASNHSVASSIELENEDQNDNDNLSDMVSANVSGRGTPNISGRDTPSSQVTENEDQRPLVEARPFLAQPQPQLKQIRSEIDDKFCKFEIKKLLEGDETISIISDTWSTDVLASDSETIDAGERHEASAALQLPHIDQPSLDVAETHSESAWSTDVLASDTERLTEVDNDDVASVAPSDDAASVARSDDAASVAPSERSEVDEHCLDRRLSAASGGGGHLVPSSPGAFQDYHQQQEAGGRRESAPNFHKAEEVSFYRGERSAFAPVESCVLRSAGRSSASTSADSAKREAVVIDRCVDVRRRQDGGDAASASTSTTAAAGAPGSSGLAAKAQSPATEPPSYILVKNAAHKFDDVKADIQLSNTSLNSSSSGSSNSSEQKGGDKWKNSKLWLNNGDAAGSTAAGDGAKKLAQKPSPSTGAIPKSISFDMSAEKGDKDLDDEQRGKRGGSFFGKLRMNFRHRRGKSLRGGGADECGGALRFEEEDARARRHSECATMSMRALQDASEDILAKYRTAKAGDGAARDVARGDKATSELDVAACQNASGSCGASTSSSNNSSIFADAKKKLRWVLSNSRTHYVRLKKDGKRHVKKDLESFLQIELAKARDFKRLTSAARVAEALRCVRLLDIAGFNKLCENLLADMRRRSAYWRYLARSKQVLLSSQAYLNELGDHVHRERDLCASFLVEVCVRNFLEKHHEELAQFCREFKQQVLIDEQNLLLEEFLAHLFGLVKTDALWQDATEQQAKLTQDALERAIMTEVYCHALYPNGDGDRHRDHVLASHLRKLASTITPGNKYLMISKVHQMECPWLPAQEALQAMAAYRTPRDKVACVTRCAFAIMDLLSLAQGSSASADDLIPVLVYVITQVNPQDLLSTIQYVNSFCAHLAGEDYFYWTQFCSAVEFTKTMEYAD